MASILLVEDDAAIRSAMTRALTARGHAVDSRSTGMAGLQAAIDDRPDVVLLDLGLPDADGSRCCTMLRAVSAVPVIIVTARDDGGAVGRGARRRRGRLRGQAVRRRAGRGAAAGGAPAQRRDEPRSTLTVGDLVVTRGRARCCSRIGGSS